jgi:hypothetical protein
MGMSKQLDEAGEREGPANKTTNTDESGEEVVERAVSADEAMESHEQAGETEHGERVKSKDGTACKLCYRS